MNVKKIATLAIASLLSLGLATACSQEEPKPPEASKTPAGKMEKTPEPGKMEKTPGGKMEKTPGGKMEKTPAPTKTPAATPTKK